MAAPALASAYLTVAEADTVLAGETEWVSASSSKKSDALSFGRAYMDSHYRCNIQDEDDAPAQVKTANALFALEYLKDNLFKEPDREVTMERIKAGEVELSESYATSGNARRMDPHPKITAVLAMYCSWKSGSVGNSFLIRA